MDDDEDFEAEREEARQLVRKLGRASIQLSQTSLEKKLRRELGPKGLAGAHIVRSFELVIEMGLDTEEALRLHQNMVEMATSVLTEFLQHMDQSGPPPRFIIPPREKSH